MASIAIIPARSGSKRIPNKNFLNVQGIPMVNHTLNLAASSGEFDEIVVSVDSEISAESILGDSARIYLRPKHLGSDQTKTIDVIREAIISLGISGSEKVCCLYPTSFLLTRNRIVQGSKLLSENKECFVFTAQQSPANPLRMFHIDYENKGLIFLDEASLHVNTQSLQTYYSDAGQCYWAHASTWIKETAILNARSIPLLLNKWETIDIDYPEDLDIALELLRIRERRV